MEARASLFSRVANVMRSLFWIFLIFLILYHWFSASSIERSRLSALEAIQGERGTRVITLIHREESVSLLGIPVAKYIDIDDAEAVLRAIRLTPVDKPIDIILHTPGGLVLAASQIAHAVQKHKGKITVFVPHYAMSGGTLVALAADQIVMDPNAVLGPVDPQIGDLPAASIIRAVELKTPQGVNDKTLILADISSKAINQVASLVAELLGKRMPEKEANELAALITTGQFTHDFPITVERAKSVGLPISTQMPESIYRLMELYPQRGTGRPSVNYVPMPKVR
ncbi:MAG: ATP-dependent Clp protease proteolytic subunit [Desulfobacteraceae bacterium]|jgi:ClpP class serine protease